MEDVFAHRGRGGGGQRQDGRFPEFADRTAEGEISGAKIVPPLADTVRFVDDEERDANPLQ